MKKQQKTTVTFLKINSVLLADSKLKLIEKIFISHILSYQNNEKECFESNPSIAKKFGVSKGVISKMITKMNKTYYSFFINEHPTNETHILKIDVKELINFLKNNLGDEVSELGLINELQSNTADLSDDKPKIISTPTEAPNEADTSFNNNYQQVDEWIPKESKSFRNEIKELGEKHIAPILKQYDKETIINKIIRYYELSPTKYNTKAATEQLIKLSDTYLADELELIVKVKKENNKSELGFALTNNNESTFGSN